MDYQTKIKTLLSTALKKNASDLHISVGHPPVLRINRDLIDLPGEDVLTSQDSQELAYALMTDYQKDRFLSEKEIDFGYDLQGQARFRINIYLESGNIAIALRLIPQKIRTIEELKLPFVLHTIADSLQGFVLFTGASSQGKSTSLAAIIDEINHKRRAHIITIEDPIEYVFEDDKCLIDQREIKVDALNFPKALRSTLREDPDVIMVGEMRDLETISTAITAAETGHLVLATLHTNSANQTIHRIIDTFPPYQQSQVRAQLSSSLLAVISQKLLLNTKKEIIPVCEIMFNNSAISNLIRENKIHEIPTIIETSREQGMISFNKSLIELVKQRQITKEMASRHSFNPKDLEERLKKT